MRTQQRRSKRISQMRQVNVEPFQGSRTLEVRSLAAGTKCQLDEKGVGIGSGPYQQGLWLRATLAGIVDKLLSRPAIYWIERSTPCLQDQSFAPL